jgi:hypothetical protein
MNTRANRLLVAGAVVLLASCTGSSSEPVPPPISAGEAAGLLDTASPGFQWPAVDGAEAYRLIVEDSAGNGYAATLDPQSANCTTEACSAALESYYHGAELSWQVESTVNGEPGPVAAGGTFSSERSIERQPITSNAQACSSWPALDYGSYTVLNNIWGARSMRTTGWEQTIHLEEDANGGVRAQWDYDWLTESDGGTFDVKAYPEVIYGNKLGTHVSAPQSQTGLPALVSELPRFDVDFSYSETGNAERNVALESFFHQSCEVTGPCDLEDNRAYEMMVWVANPELRKPGSTLAETGVEIDGRLWDVWIKPAQDSHYIAFTAQEDITSGSLHWNEFVEWTRVWSSGAGVGWGMDPLLPEHCMGAIEIGTELWWGKGTFSLDRYDVQVR